jgi:hypothetical protein
MKVALGIASVILAIGAVACGSETSSAAPAPTTGGAQTPAATTEAAKPKCDPAPQALIDGIMTGAQSGTGAKAIRGVTWKSPDFSKVWFVGVRFSATGVGDQTMVFATNSLTRGGGLIMAVDGFAQQFTDWGKAQDINAADRGVDIVKDCLS